MKCTISYRVKEEYLHNKFAANNMTHPENSMTAVTGTAFVDDRRNKGNGAWHPFANEIAILQVASIQRSM